MAKLQSTDIICKFELFEVQILIDELQRSISSLGESDDESDIAYMEELERIREKLKKEAD